MAYDLSLDFFLGSNSDHGFVSHFSQLQNPDNGIHLFLLKGGPGTGKSSFMKKIASSFDGRTEQIHCSSDPDSLDGILLEQKGVCLLDATPPHVLEPRWPGVVEQTIDLSEALMTEKLTKHRREILETTQKVSLCHKKFCSLLKCANTLLEENRTLLSSSVNLGKITATTKRIAKKEFASLPSGAATPKFRMLSAFTPKGMITYQETIQKLCNRIYLLHDEHRIAAPLFLDLLHQELSQKKVTYYLCFSPFHPDREIDAILIPQLHLGFAVTDIFRPLQNISDNRTIHATRFLEKDVLRHQKQKLHFYQKNAKILLAEGIEQLQKAKTLHDQLESYYTPCMDFKKATEKGEHIIHSML